MLGVALTVLTACDHPTLVVTVSLHEQPVAGLTVTALPFDPEAILESLAEAAEEPKPDFSDLEAALLQFVPSDNAAIAAINAPWLALRDTITAAADSLQRTDRRTAAYAAAYDRFRNLYARFTLRTAERDRALEGLEGNDVRLARWAQAAADSLRDWERNAFAPYDSLAGEALVASERGIAVGVTDHDGGVELKLPAGLWWVVARVPDAANPFAEYHWNVAVRVNSLVPTALPLTVRGTTKRWRH